MAVVFLLFSTQRSVNAGGTYVPSALLLEKGAGCALLGQGRGPKYCYIAIIFYYIFTISFEYILHCVCFKLYCVGFILFCNVLVCVCVCVWGGVGVCVCVCVWVL